MNAEVAGSLLLRSLRAQGFAYLETAKNGWSSFGGVLSVDDMTTRVVLSVDPRGIDLPKIRIAEIPPRLRGIPVPHLTQDGNLCYLAEGSVVPDVFDLAGQTLACLEKARIILGEILRGGRKDDILEEFFAYWGTPSFSFCTDISRCGLDLLQGILFVDPRRGADIIAFTRDPTSTVGKFSATGLVAKRQGLPTRLVRTAVAPRYLPGCDWPPKTVGALLNWQNALDRATSSWLRKHLIRDLSLGRRCVYYLIESPKLTYGFQAVLAKAPAPAPGKRKQSIDRRKLLLESEVKPMYITRTEDSYMAERSCPNLRTLAGRRIAVVGCGTIGGFLAELLIKAGAGVDNGRLTLVDKDTLLPQNVGRHRLGFGAILKNKATALASELLRSAPGADVRAIPSDVVDVDLNGNDLVVDATGEEAMGHWLARQLQHPFIPSVVVWIEGPGTAVRGLLRDCLGAACLRCLNTLDRTPRFPSIHEAIPAGLEGHGCESLYVPFPVTASVQAACLGAEMVAAWANDRPSPRLRTRVLDAGLSRATPDLDPDILEACPSCSG